jgi:hypothetical protein
VMDLIQVIDFKKNHQCPPFCGITLLAHDNIAVLIIIDISLIQKIHIQWNSSKSHINNHMKLSTKINKKNLLTK